MSPINPTSPLQFDSIIFATDFSPSSRNAGLYASAMSVHFRTNLVIAHAFTLSQAALEVEAENPRTSLQRLELGRALLLLAGELKGARGMAQTILMEGDPRKEIPALADGKNPSLVVLGTHGGGSIDRWVLGSTAEGILRHSSGPTLTIGPHVNILRAAPLNIRRILYATDCTPDAAHAAPFAFSFANSFSAELEVLNVVHSSDIDHPEQLRLLQEHFYGAVEAIMPHEAGQICKPHSFVSVGQPHTEILNHIEAREIDLLILGLRRNTLSGLQNRTSRVFPIIVEAKCPVITVASGSTHHP